MIFAVRSAPGIGRRGEESHLALQSAALFGWPGYCVVTATLVLPRTAPVLSVKVTKMRLFAGSNATALLAFTKSPKVGVALLPIVVVTLAEGVCMQAPVLGLV